MLTFISVIGFLFGFGLLIGLLALVIIGIKRRRYIKKEVTSKLIGANALDKFFVECVLAKLTDFSVPINKERAKLIADKYKLKYPDGIENLYQQALENHKAVSRLYKRFSLAELREKDKNMFDSLNKYSDLTGKNKRIAMLNDIAASYWQKAANQKEYANLLMRSGQQKEKNWAVHGGIAQGLGGIGAGIATAAHVQQQNMQIREANENYRRTVLPTHDRLRGSADDNRNKAAEIMKKIEDFKLKLVSDESADELMKRISFSNTDVRVSETGAVTVRTTASLDSSFRIFNDVPAIIDGTILAEIYDGNQPCGTAHLVLPLYGLERNVNLKGICLDCGKPGTTYTVKFVPKHLCAIEK